MKTKPIYKRQILADAFLLGFTTLGSQIILLREFLLVFSNNELVIGLLLTIWMLTFALGSWIARFFNKNNIRCTLLRVLLLFISAYPLFAAFTIEFLRNIFFEPGRMLSFFEITGFSLMILFPLCFAGGFLFVLLNYLSAEHKTQPGKLYSFESLGGMTGGIIVSLFFIYFLKIDNFKSLEYVLYINLIYLTIHDFRQGQYKFVSFFLALLLGALYFLKDKDLNIIAKEKLFNNQTILETKESYYGNVTVTSVKSQINFYQNNLFIFSTGDVIRKEEDVNYAMFQRVDATKVLIAGGGITGTTTEVLKYPSVNYVDYVEINPDLIALGRKYTDNLNDNRIKVFNSDPSVYIKKTKEKYDVVLSNTPPPSNAGLNRYYTVDYFKLVKQVLNNNGILSCRLPYSENYQSKDELELQESVYNGLKANFKNVIVVPGKMLYFLASDSLLDYNYEAKFKLTDIVNKYVNGNYIKDMLLRFRADRIIASYNNDKIINKDFKPVVYFSYLKHWLNFFNLNINIFPGLIVFLIIFFLIYLNADTTSVFISGFTSSATEVILIIAFQIISGNIYLLIGFIVTFFMTGLALGSLKTKSDDNVDIKTRFLKIQFSSGMVILIITVTLVLLKSFKGGEFVAVIFYMFTFIIAFLTGMQYTAGVQSKGKNIVSSVYSSDMIGAAAGSLLAVIYIVPKFGLVFALILLAMIHFVNLFLIKIKPLSA
jgi:spermidine synthase